MLPITPFDSRIASFDTAGIRSRVITGSSVIVSEHQSTERVSAATIWRRWAWAGRVVCAGVDRDLQLFGQVPQLLDRVHDVDSEWTAGDMLPGPQHVHVIDADLSRVVAALDAAIFAR